MMKYKKNVYEGQNVYLQYYEIRNGLKPLVLLHAQAVDSTSYFGVMPKLAQHFHVYAVAAMATVEAYMMLQNTT